jgi:hypothetical protein
MDGVTIVTAGNHKFREHVSRSKEAAEGFGCNVVVYDLGDLGFGKPIETPEEDLKKQSHGFISCLFKHDIIEETLREHDRVAYVDGDAILTQPIDSVFDDEFDVGVTIRTVREIRQYLGNPKVGYFNSGILFVRQTPAAFNWIEQWRTRSAEVQVEQAAVNDLIIPHMSWDPKSNDEPPTFVETPGVRIRIFECLDYNNFYKDKRRAKIIHYKNTVK